MDFTSPANSDNDYYALPEVSQSMHTWDVDGKSTGFSVDIDGTTQPHDHLTNQISLRFGGKQRPSMVSLLRRRIQDDDGDDDVTEEERKRKGSKKDASWDVEYEPPPLVGAGGIQSTKATDDYDKEELEASMLPQPQDDSIMRRFGMWDGVFARSCLGLFGVILFLRIGYLTSIAGVWWMTGVILLAAGISILTTLSLSAVCTNGQVMGGGAYFMISRALGPAFGGSIGIIFSLANMVSVALYSIGFAETLASQFSITGDRLMDVRLIGLVTVIIILIMCLIGVDWVVKLQLGLLGILLTCVIIVYIGMFVKSDPGEGFTGVSATTFDHNMGDKFGREEFGSRDFFYCLSIFFPAYCGLLAGANMSGEIRNPSYSIPYGTLYAVVFATLVYLSMTVMLGASVEREGQDGPKTGLFGNYFILADVAVWKYLVYFGIYAATVSSAIASLVGAPRILQAVGVDGIFPFLQPFAKGHGPTNEPWRGYFLTFIIAIACVAIGELNAIAPMITAFFMMAYAQINLACFAASWSRSPGWRPGFKYYNQWLALLAFLICVALMFLMSWIYGLVTAFISTALYFYVIRTNPDVSWGSSPEAMVYVEAFRFLRRLDRIPMHVKTYRPSLLILCGEPAERVGLVQFCDQFRKSGAMHLYANVIVSQCDVKEMLKGKTFLKLRNKCVLDRAASPLTSLHVEGLRVIKGFTESFVAPSFLDGVVSLLQLGGVSRMRPNVTVMGYRDCFRCTRNAQEQDNNNDDDNEDDNEKDRLIDHDKNNDDDNKSKKQQEPYDEEQDQKRLVEYVNVVRTCFFFQQAVCILRNWRDLTLSTFDKTNTGFEGTIDVWPLADDGGLSLLLPFLLHKHPVWKNSRLRIMVPTIRTAEDVDREAMDSLLERFRIEGETILVDVDSSLEDVSAKISTDMLNHHAQLLGPHSEEEKLESSDQHWNETLKQRHFHLRLAEKVAEFSQSASLIVFSLPIPELGIDEREYMSWLECVSAPYGNQQFPPTLFVRGANEDVLTFDL